MTGTSRLPVSLREGFNSVRKRSQASNPLAMLNLDLSVPIPFCFPCLLAAWSSRAMASALFVYNNSTPISPTEHSISLLNSQAPIFDEHP
jgi:hypothetical protein